MKHCFLLLSIFLFAAVKESDACTPGLPTNLKMTNITSCSATLSWSAATGNISYYKVKYKVTGTIGWQTSVNVNLDLSYTFTGLDPNTSYDFAVSSFCSDGTSSGFVSITKITKTCTIPTVNTLSVYNDHSALIGWDGCSSIYNQIRYRKSSSSSWFYLSTGTAQSVNITTLSKNTSYVYQLASCQDTTGNWTKLDSFETVVGRPNILLIVLDDSRFDTYSCNGGPTWFKSSNVDRIANEGANFKVSCSVYAYCVPSRGTIVTGLYPHKNGAIDNTTTINPALKTTATILDSAGYYTGWIGKYHMELSPQPGYNYWLASKMNSGTDEYNNLTYDYNGTKKTINGHDTDILTDSTLTFLDRHYAQNFFLTVAYHAPHQPYIPQPQYAGIYADDPMPVPTNTAPYNVNFPSFLYRLPSNWYVTPQEIPGDYEGYFELLAGIDAAVGDILQKLTDYDILDNTVVIFTSDHGYMFGEHGLYNKRFAYDPSIRIPLFIRYPKWYAANTVINNQIALNIDFAPTILAAAGIKGNYKFDGSSLKDLSDGLVNRPYIYYEYIFNSGVSKLPFIRAVRSLNDMYISYGCNSQTEEFFDLTIDPLENTNQIKKTSYTTLINTFRAQLSSLEASLQDGYLTPVITCYLQNPHTRLSDDVNYNDSDFDFDPTSLTLYPVPANDEVNYTFFADEDDANGKIIITNYLGEVVQQENIAVQKGQNDGEIKFNTNISTGIYYVTTTSTSGRFTNSIMVSR